MGTNTQGDLGGRSVSDFSWRESDRLRCVGRGGAARGCAGLDVDGGVLEGPPGFAFVSLADELFAGQCCQSEASQSNARHLTFGPRRLGFRSPAVTPLQQWTDQARTSRNATAHSATVTTNAIRNGRSFLSSNKTGLYVRMLDIKRV